MRHIRLMKLEMMMVGSSAFIAAYNIFFLKCIGLLLDYYNRMVWMQLIFTPQPIISIDHPKHTYKQTDLQSILRPKTNTTLRNK